MPFTRILVALDGSRFAEQALHQAVELARANSASLYLLSVYSDPAVSGEAEEYLHRQLQRLQSLDLKVMTLACQGDPVECILHEIDVQQVDLVVMCSHGRTGLSRWLMGSITEEVMRHAHCPTLVVRPTPGKEEKALPEVDARPRLMVLLDGSSEAESAMDFASLYGKNYEIVLFRVVERSEAEYFANPAVSEQIHRMSEMARSYLESCALKLRKDGHTVRTRLAVGPPAPEILEAAEREGVSLLVVTSQARRGSARALLGSVAETVCRGAACPVLRIRPRTAPRLPEQILIPLDGSEQAEKALDYVSLLPVSEKRACTLLMAADLPVSPPEFLVETQQEQLSEKRAYLDKMAQPLRQAGWLVSTDLEVGNPEMRILERARMEPFDLILMTTHGRTGPSRWLLGSVAESIARRSTVPVMLVNAKTPRLAPAQPELAKS